MLRFTNKTDPKANPTTVLCDYTYETNHKTVLVVGVTQGGTSMVAAVVDSLGIPISEERFNYAPSTRPNVTDDIDMWREKVLKVNAKRDVWGFKDGEVWRFSPACVSETLRNPYYIVASRDVLATTQRRVSSYDMKPSGNVREVITRALGQVVNLWDWVKELPPAPILLVSYERAISNRETTCKQIAEFVGVSSFNLDHSVSCISPVGGYLLGENSSYPDECKSRKGL